MSESGRTLAERAARRREVALAGHRGDTTTALRFVDDPDPLVRATALRALDRADALDDARLVAARREEDPSVRRSVAELVARRSSPHLDDTVLALLGDTDGSVVEVAAWTAGERERNTATIVRRLSDLTTGHEDALVREAAVAALGAIGDPSGLPAVLAATTDRATVRRRAVLALAPFDGPEVEAALRHALDDRDWQVRQAAEDLLT